MGLFGLLISNFSSSLCSLDKVSPCVSKSWVSISVLLGVVVTCCTTPRLYGCWDQNSSPVPSENMFLTAEASLQCPHSPQEPPKCCIVFSFQHGYFNTKLLGTEIPKGKFHFNLEKIQRVHSSCGHVWVTEICYANFSGFNVLSKTNRESVTAQWSPLGVIRLQVSALIK